MTLSMTKTALAPLTAAILACSLSSPALAQGDAPAGGSAVGSAAKATIRVVLVVRQAGRADPDFFLPVDLPAVPTVGSYISVRRPNAENPQGNNAIVREVWWRLSRAEAAAADANPEPAQVEQIFVECEPTRGPYTSDHWIGLYDLRRAVGAVLPKP